MTRPFRAWMLAILTAFSVFVIFLIRSSTHDIDAYRSAADKKIAELNTKRDSNIAHEQAVKAFAFDDCNKHSGVAVMGFGPSVVCLSTIGVDLPRVYMLEESVGTVRDERGRKVNH